MNVQQRRKYDPDFRNIGRWRMGSGHAKYLIIYKKGSKNSRFFVLNIQFWVQNNRSKDFFEILFSLKGSFWG